MGKNLKKEVLVSEDTGEVIYEKTFFTFDGFTDKGYKYRYRSDYIRYYFDSVPGGLSEGAFLLLIMLAEMCNEENILVYRVKRKSRFSNILYKPMDKEMIRNSLRYKFGENKFDKCWRELKKHCIKQIEYNNNLAWVINPAIVSRCKVLPDWLYNEFDTYLVPYLSKIAIKKFQDRKKTLDL